MQNNPTHSGEPNHDRNAVHAYSEVELAHFKELILVKRSNVLAELYQLRKRLADEMDKTGGFDPYKSYFSAATIASTQQQELYLLIMRQQKQLDLLDKALHRIANKRYGICKITGKRIPKERLEAFLHTEVYVMSAMQN